MAGCEQVMSGVPRVVRFNIQCMFNRPEDELWPARQHRMSAPLRNFVLTNGDNQNS